MLRFLLFILFPIVAFAQNNIKTAQLFNPQTNDLTPIISKNEYLIFSFDDLDGQFKRYEYKIVRYNRLWEKSDAFTSEFLDGYDKNYIQEYQNSFNTRVNYTHYKVKIPNRDFKFKLSGNYGIQLISPENGAVLLEKRFSVYDKITQIGVKVDRINHLKDKNQRISVQVASPQFDLTQNSRESMLTILKNGNWHEILNIEQAVFAQPNSFTYNQLDNNFNGGVEYNYFDTKNIEIASMSTERIIRGDVYEAVLYSNSFERDAPYVDQPDVNGNYYIRNVNIPNTANTGSESDYVMVHFALANYTPEIDEEVCVYGAFTNFTCTEESTLKYNPETNLLETNMLLKQGYYNYSFVSKNTFTQDLDYTKITGSYWQTENVYNALLYYRPWGERYDLIIGYGEGFSKPSQR